MRESEFGEAGGHEAARGDRGQVTAAVAARARPASTRPRAALAGLVSSAAVTGRTDVIGPSAGQVAPLRTRP
ncbi:hypothetical protein AB0J35_37355 [Nonomuraea angiospora]|uniref:hypothetical protein n=1 Tax=Nonomuraea angiospora TaxID=46172 RepID=UPI00341AD3E3